MCVGSTKSKERTSKNKHTCRRQPQHHLTQERDSNRLIFSKASCGEWSPCCYSNTIRLSPLAILLRTMSIRMYVPLLPAPSLSTEGERVKGCLPWVSRLSKASSQVLPHSQVGLGEEGRQHVRGGEGKGYTHTVRKKQDWECFSQNTVSPCLPSTLRCGQFCQRE